VTIGRLSSEDHVPMGVTVEGRIEGAGGRGGGECETWGEKQGGEEGV